MGYDDFDTYQKNCRKTAVYPNIGKNYIYPTLGLAGEAGEVAEKIKKIIRDNGGVITKEKKQEIIKELGDVMWYVSSLATELDVKLSKVAKTNINKLQSRSKRGVLHGQGDLR